MPPDFISDAEMAALEGGSSAPDFISDEEMASLESAGPESWIDKASQLARGAVITAPLKAGAGVLDLISAPFEYASDKLLGTDFANTPGFSSEMAQKTLPQLEQWLGAPTGAYTSKDNWLKAGEFVSPMGRKGLVGQTAAGLGAFAGSEIAEEYAPDSPIAQLGLTAIGAMSPAGLRYGTKAAIGELLSPTASTAKAVAEDFRSVVPDAFTTAMSSDERARAVAEGLASRQRAAKQMGGMLFDEVGNEAVYLDDAIKEIEQVALKAEGAINPDSTAGRIIDYLKSKGVPEQVIEAYEGAPAMLNKTIPGTPAKIPLRELQNTLRDAGQRAYSATQGVNRYVAGEAKDILLRAAEKSVSPQAMQALTDARGYWKQIKQAFDEGATAKVIDSLEQGGKYKSFKNALTSDAKSAQELVSVMTKEELEHAKGVMLEDLTQGPAVGWESKMRKQLGSYKAVFGEAEADELLTMLSREGSIGQKLLKDNHGLTNLFGSMLGKASLPTYFLGPTVGPLVSGAMLGKDMLNAIGRNRGRALIMRAAAGSPNALEILNAPYKNKFAYESALKKLPAILTQAGQANLKPVDAAMDRAEEKVMAKQEAPKTPSMVSAKRTEDFLSKEEGGQRLKAYPPPAKGSGVTVGTGVDLGTKTKNDLKRIGISDGLISKLEPYLGKKDDAARRALKRETLRLTKDEADELDLKVRGDIESTIDAKFQKASGSSIADLPGPARTVVQSLAYNFGPNVDESLPTIWKAIVAKDWPKLQKLLISTKWKQPELVARRKREAALLEPLVLEA